MVRGVLGNSPCTTTSSTSPSGRRSRSRVCRFRWGHRLPARRPRREPLMIRTRGLVKRRGAHAAPGEVAVLPDTPRFYPWLTGREVVALALALSPAGGREHSARDADRIEEVLSQSGLSEASSRRCGGYARGMLQRLGIACALVARPTLILLDEPASALDPQGRREVLDLIATLPGHATVSRWLPTSLANVARRPARRRHDARLLAHPGRHRGRHGPTGGRRFCVGEPPRGLPTSQRRA